MPYTKNTIDNFPYEIFKSENGAPLSSVDKGSIPSGGTFNGDFNPLWRDQIRQGSNATTAASGKMITINPGFLDLYGRVDVKPQFGGGVLGSSQVTGIPPLQGLDTVSSLPPDSIVTEVTNRAIRKFLSSADQVRSSIEFGQDLGEWKETLHGLISPVKSLREFTFSHLSKVLKLTKTVKHKASLSKMVADTWLEFKFGWFPLASDIGAAYADFTNNRNHQSVQPIYAGATGHFLTFLGPVSGYATGLGGASCMLRVTAAYSVRLKGAIRTGAVNGRIASNQLLQLDLPHFIPTIWDLLPYSWIADYFVNIGEIINAACFNSSNMAWGVKTVKTSYNYDYSWSWDVSNFSPVFYQVGDVQSTIDNPSAIISSFTRSVIGSEDLIPQVRISLPLGSEKPWENMAALLFGRQKEISRVASNLR